MLQILFDILMVLIIAAYVFWSVKRGFVKSFLKSTKLIFVIIVTLLIGSLVVSVCQTAFVSGMFEGKISEKLVAQAEQSDGELTFETIKDGIPDIVENIVPMDEIEKDYAMLSGDKTEIANQVGEKIEGVLTVIVSNVIGYILAFVISFIICTVAIWLIGKFFEIPGLKWLNRLAGVLWGLASAYLTTSFVSCIVALIFGNGFIAETVITKFIYNIGLFSF